MDLNFNFLSSGTISPFTVFLDDTLLPVPIELTSRVSKVYSVDSSNHTYNLLIESLTIKRKVTVMFIRNA